MKSTEGTNLAGTIVDQEIPSSLLEPVQTV